MTEPAPREHLEWLPLSQPAAPSPPPADTASPAASAPAEAAPTGPAVVLPTWTFNAPAPPEDWFNPAKPDSLAMYRLRLLAEQFRTSGGFDQLICLDDISIDHYPYQIEAALHALRDMGGHALLADEVGLGKTIEAGIVMKELLERGLVKRVMVIVPASLTRQWQEELQTKFHEDFIVLEKPEHLPAGSDTAPARWIISYNRAQAPGWADKLAAFEYDLLILDEAHRLKNHQTGAYRLVDRLRKRYALLLTATPVHNHLLELYNLVTILRPGHLGTRAAFRRNFVAVRQTQRRPHWRVIYSREDAPGYLRKTRSIRQEWRAKNDIGVKALSYLDDFTKFLQTYSPADKRDPVAAKIRQIERLIATDYTITNFEALQWKPWLGKPRFDFVCHLQLKPEGERTAPPTSTAQPGVSPKNPAALRSLLREVMIRNRRSSVGVRFPPREAAVYHLNFTPPEQALYQGVTACIRELLAQSEQDETARTQLGALRLSLSSLQRRLCSSPQATAQSLEKLIARRADPRLQTYLELARNIPEGRKVDAVRVILSQYPGKFLIFTDYLPTMHTLQAALTSAGQETVLFHGGLSALERFETVRAFRQSARVMISTQSGGEGHNLQFCRQMINFDLPWNPMRIEQRIGRIHRLGQKETVRIFNLSVNHTIEAYVLNLLANKIRMFELVIGELDLILGNLDDERSFEDLIQEAWATSRSETELLAKISQLEAMLARAEGTYQKIRTASDELSALLET